MVRVERSSISASSGFMAGEEATAHAFGGKLDRRERILDLVREPARHFAPGRVALRLQQRRDVVEHDDVADLAILIRAAVCRHTSACGGSMLLSRSICSRHSSRPAAKRTASAATNWPRRSLLAASSGSVRPVAAERSVPRIAPAASLAMRTVSIAIDAEHAGRQAREKNRETRALALHGLLAARRFFARAAQALGHVVERMHEEAHLVARRQRQARAEIALADGARAGDEILHGTREPLRREDRAVDGREHREQQHESQREPEAVLQRLAQRRRGRRTASRRAARLRTAPRVAAARGRSRRRSDRPCSPACSASGAAVRMRYWPSSSGSRLT